MFEVTSGEISQLDDSHLRELVARLCGVELAAAGLPRSAVRWGGNQRAEDGGVDVRVDLEAGSRGLDFVPRTQTGFQVKQEKEFGPAKVKNEMALKGQPRPVLQKLADVGGAYIIVNGSRSLADKPLQNRLAAMRSVADELRGGGRLELDFYDGSRIGAQEGEGRGCRGSAIGQAPGRNATARSRRAGTRLCATREVPADRLGRDRV
jgi:hypothetical protein